MRLCKGFFLTKCRKLKAYQKLAVYIHNRPRSNVCLSSRTDRVQDDGTAIVLFHILSSRLSILFRKIWMIDVKTNMFCQLYFRFDDLEGFSSNWIRIKSSPVEKGLPVCQMPNLMSSYRSETSHFWGWRIYCHCWHKNSNIEMYLQSSVGRNDMTMKWRCLSNCFEHMRVSRDVFKQTLAYADVNLEKFCRLFC